MLEKQVERGKQIIDIMYNKCDKVCDKRNELEELVDVLKNSAFHTDEDNKVLEECDQLIQNIYDYF